MFCLVSQLKFRLKKNLFHQKWPSLGINPKKKQYCLQKLSIAQMPALLPDFNDIFWNLGIWVMIKFTKLQIWQQTTGSPKCSIGLGKWPRGSIYTPIYLWFIPNHSIWITVAQNCKIATICSVINSNTILKPKVTSFGQCKCTKRLSISNTQATKYYFSHSLVIQILKFNPWNQKNEVFLPFLSMEISIEKVNQRGYICTLIFGSFYLQNKCAYVAFIVSIIYSRPDLQGIVCFLVSNFTHL